MESQAKLNESQSKLAEANSRMFQRDAQRLNAARNAGVDVGRSGWRPSSIHASAIVVKTEHNIGEANITPEAQAEGSDLN